MLSRSFPAVFSTLLLAHAQGCGDPGQGSPPTWHTTLPNPDEPGSYGALAMTPSGVPWTGYISGITERVYVGQPSGDTLVMEEVPGSQGALSELVLATDAQGNPHVAWVEANGIRYAFRSAEGWHREVVHGEAQGANIPAMSLALDSAGNPAISFFAGDNQGMRLATRALDGSWGLTIPDATPYAGFHGTALAFDAQDMPVLAYFVFSYQVAEQRLMLARYINGTLDISQVDSGEDVGPYPSLVLDPSGAPHLSYYAYGNIRYAAWDGAAWKHQDVNRGFITGLALERDGTPLVACGESSGGFMRVFRSSGDGTWSRDTVPRVSSAHVVDVAVGPDGAWHVAADSGGMGLVYAVKR